jgi:hypothetical protein
MYASTPLNLPGMKHFETSAHEKGVDLNSEPSVDTRTPIQTWQGVAASERIGVSCGHTGEAGSVHSSGSRGGRSLWSVSSNATWPPGFD